MKKIIFLIIPAVTFLLVFASSNSSSWVEGIVVDANSSPIAGVEIKSIPGAAKTYSSSTGAFKIEVASLHDKLSFLKAGYLFQVVPIGGKTNIKVALRHNSDNVLENKEYEEHYVVQ